MEAEPHIFVAHADLTKLACDLVLVPTDESLDVREPFRGYFGVPRRPLPTGCSGSGVRVTDAVPEPSRLGRLVRWVNTGSVPERADVDWLLEGVRQGLDAAAHSLRSNEARNGRARLPLVGLPLFGTGAGGFDTVRGRVLDGILRECGKAARRHGYDVAIACWLRSDYAALQDRRREQGVASPVLRDGLMAEAQRLGTLARKGYVALFLGAGVSQPAGLPSWPGLIKLLAEKSTALKEQVDELNQIPLIDAASLLEKDLGPQRFGEILRDVLTRDLYPVGQALLASLRTREAITTNFDTLYEQAWLDTPPRILPRQRAEPDQPWLLKMHGDIGAGQPGKLVLGRDEYLGFDAQWRPLASMVQAAMMTRHLLFVGFSLNDENFIRLGRDVSLLLERMELDHKVGTVLALHEDALLTQLWPHLRFVAMGPRDADMTGAARILDIFLDCVAMHAASGEKSYLLDPRYEALVDAADSAIYKKLMEFGQALDEERGDRWSDIAEFLKRYGYSARRAHPGP